jgi:hypothetical protein
MISTGNLELLPNIPVLLRLTQSLAMLDAVLSPKWDLRYYSFNSRWANGLMMASMRDGSGNAWFLQFGEEGAILKGFDHESPMAEQPVWPGVLSDVPAAFGRFLTQPAFSMEDTTFCIWRLADDTRWRTGRPSHPFGAELDGSAEMLSILDGDPASCQRWAEEYYEREIDLAPVSRLNPDVTLDDLGDDVAEIGYPT